MTEPHPYKRAYRNGRHFMVHRLVMEDHIGRPLEQTELVHHINGDRHDNRIENLQIVNVAQHGVCHRLDPESVTANYSVRIPAALLADFREAVRNSEDPEDNPARQIRRFMRRFVDEYQQSQT